MTYFSFLLLQAPTHLFIEYPGGFGGIAFNANDIKGKRSSTTNIRSLLELSNFFLETMHR
jgi:hypothetical protein